MKPTILILASALGVTACGKKRAECKTLVEEFNASVKALNEAKEEVGSEPKDLISSLDAHIDAAEKLGEALDGMEVTTEELQPIVEEAKTAANAKVEASKRAKASMQSLESLTSDARNQRFIVQENVQRAASHLHGHEPHRAGTMCDAGDPRVFLHEGHVGEGPRGGRQGRRQGRGAGVQGRGGEEGPRCGG
jgi:hypothetical protein